MPKCRFNQPRRRRQVHPVLVPSPSSVPLLIRQFLRCPLVLLVWIYLYLYLHVCMQTGSCEDTDDDLAVLGTVRQPVSFSFFFPSLVSFSFFFPFFVPLDAPLFLSFLSFFSLHSFFSLFVSIEMNECILVMVSS